MNEITQIKEKLAALEAALLSKSPSMPTILQQIHTTLKSQPHVVSILEEKDVGTIVSALKSHTGNFIAVNAAKKSSSASEKKALKAMSASDLF
jgi:folylpolyglutamate synthase/dihydropteroate synthase